MTDALRISDLAIRYTRPDRDDVVAVDGLGLEVGDGEVVALVGESGSGKSSVLLAVLGLLPPSARVEGTIEVDGRAAGPELRGATIGSVFQDPVASLHPLRRVGDQVAEVVRVHEGGSKRTALDRVRDLFTSTGLDPESTMRRYPHQLSGGQCQRVALAAALAGHPRLLLADEPTSSLDVIVQAQIVELLRAVRVESGAAMLLVTHDLGVAALLADRVAVLHRGAVVERGPAAEILAAPEHPYTKSLVAARR